MTKGSREVFRFAICENCGSASNLDFPSDISRFYDGYYSFSDNDMTLDLSWWKRFAVYFYSRLIVGTNLSWAFRSFFRCPTPRQMRVLSPNLQAFLFVGAKGDAQILDVGSGSGQFVRMMRRFGYKNAVGIDPFLDVSAKLPYVRRGSIQGEHQVYDVVLFNHSLEHATDPEAALRKCGELLAPDGVAIVHVPNMQAAKLVEFKQDWCWLHAPYHFALPSPKGMGLLAQRCGLSVVDLICTSRYDHYLYHDEYRRDIADNDSASMRRDLERGSFEPRRWATLSKLAYSLNRNLTGDWIAYYLKRDR